MARIYELQVCPVCRAPTTHHPESGGMAFGGHHYCSECSWVSPNTSPMSDEMKADLDANKPITIKLVEVA